MVCARHVGGRKNLFLRTTRRPGGHQYADACRCCQLGGEVGDAIAASGLVHDRVYYELDPETGRSEFVGKEKMLQLLSAFPELRARFEGETSESAEVVGRYLKMIQTKNEPL